MSRIRRSKGCGAIIPAAPIARSASSSTAEGRFLHRQAGAVGRRHQILLRGRVRPAGSGVRPCLGQSLEPEIAGLDRHAHAREPVRLIGIAGPSRRVEMAGRGIEERMHPSDLHGEEADGARREPRLSNIVVGTSQRPFRLDTKPGEIGEVTARGPHAQRAPPGTVDAQFMRLATMYICRPECVADRHDGVRQAVHPGGEGLLAFELSGNDPERIVRRVRVPDTKNTASRRPP